MKKFNKGVVLVTVKLIVKIKKERNTNSKITLYNFIYNKYEVISYNYF